MKGMKPDIILQHFFKIVAIFFCCTNIFAKFYCLFGCTRSDAEVGMVNISNFGVYKLMTCPMLFTDVEK